MPRRIFFKENSLLETPPSGYKAVGIDQSELIIVGTGSITNINTSLSVTGTNIDFRRNKIFNSLNSPGTQSITEDLVDAKIGVVQKIYHLSETEPEYPFGWIKLGSGIYSTSSVNRIYVEWIVNTG